MDKPETAGRIRSGPARAPSIWAFVVADTASFGLFFAVFMVERLGQPALFARSADLLDSRMGLANTLILITSSWLVALAVLAARRGAIARLRLILPAAAGVGACFAVVKLAEYGDKFRHGITPLTNDFFTYYFILTGVHFLHYLIGMAVLLALTVMAYRRSSIDGRMEAWLESGALYWHMVDLLWVFLFPILYLQGTA